MFQRYSFALLFSLVGLSPLSSQDYPTDYFGPPLDIPLYLSGTFGELRGNHFHSGMDIKTNQVEGQRVLAAAEGEVYRIKVSPYGFGKALYIRHPNGYSTVYAHLQRFSDTIEQYVREQQYQQEKFDVELFPGKASFRVDKGELIAYSGNTGGSGGPHLHFEVRDTRTENIINPLLFGFDVKDTRPPDLYNLEVYEFEDDELVSSEMRDILRISSGEYSLSGSNLVEVHNKPAFGITTYDRQNGANNRNGPYRIKMCIGEETYYDFKMETFAFSETRYINSHMDYALQECCRRKVNKMYLEPGNKLSLYGVKKPMNFPELEPDSIYEVEISVTDVAGNESALNFELIYAPTESAEVLEPDVPATIFSYDQPNFLKKEDLELSMPAGALYRDIYLEYRKSPACSGCLSPVYHISSPEIPVHKYFTLKIKLNEKYTGDKSKLMIASLEDGNIEDYEGGSYSKGWVTARTRQFGDFAVVADTVEPEIMPLNFRPGSTVRSLSELSVRIDDDLSGINTYRAEVDEKWVLMEYDAKNDKLFGNISEWPVQRGEHTLRVQVTDEVGNTAVKEYKLIF